MNAGKAYEVNIFATFIGFPADQPDPLRMHGMRFWKKGISSGKSARMMQSLGSCRSPTTEHA
jgi:hypothetical protein